LRPQRSLDIDPTDRGSAFVLRFFWTPAGSVKCRITDVRTSRSWIVDKAHDLRALLGSLRDPEHRVRKE
jgi:hypothetical protein